MTTEPSAKRGFLTIAVLAAVLIAAIVAAVKLWPDSPQERQVKAVDACKTAVDDKAPTGWRKLWQDSAFDVTGDKTLTVTGEFSTKDSGMRQFTCVVDDGKVTSVKVDR